MFVAERFMSDLVKGYGKHPVSTDGGTWYPQACEFLRIDHDLHFFLAKMREKPYCKDYAVHQGQNRMFR